MAPHRDIGRYTDLTLRALSADPFVQAAAWRLYCEAPTLLAPNAYEQIHTAQRKDNP